MDLKKICRGCFREKPEAGGICPYCGFDEIKYERERDPEVLPLNTVLRGTYVIGRCLGRGGFGITYMGWHTNLQTVVAIKEFFPSGIVSRDTGNPNHATRSDVTMVNTGSTKAYRKSLDGFIKEARTLGGLNLPGVVRVHDFFEENRTAYIVMDYVEGENLSLWLKHSGGKLPEAQVLKLIRPLTGSLQKLHEKGIIHRDISPDNLILQPDGSIMLVDFGAARSVVLEQEAEKAVQSMTVVLKPGYAPIEQYSSHGHQGPWTDVYAFCATVFRMLTGAAPADPGTRTNNDNDEEMLRSNLEKAGVSQRTIKALMKGLQLRAKDRYQSMRELEEALYKAEETGKEPISIPSQPSGKRTNKGLIVAILAGVIVLIAAAIGFTIHSRNSKRQEATERVSEAETQKVTEKVEVMEPQEDSETEAMTESRDETERTTETETETETETATEITDEGMNKEDSYNNAIELMKQGSYEEAAIELEKISGYEKSEELLQECENMKLWYPIYRNLVEHSTIKGVSCITHSKEERDAIKEVVSSDVSVQEFDPMNPEITLGVFFWNTGGPDNFPVEIGDSKESAFDKLGITENMMEDIGNGYWPSYSNELEGISIGRYTSDNSFASISFGRKDKTSITLEFSPDPVKLEGICFNDYSDHSEEAKEFEEQINKGEENAIDWNSQTTFDVGDIVKFGQYEQDGNTENGSEDISWYVVASENNQYLLVSRLGLDIVEYDKSEEGELNWSDCYVRQWLQNEFYTSAFDDEEKNVILSKKLDVKDYFGGADDLAEETEDRVFLLSSDEVNTYLDDMQRMMLVSEYVKDLTGDHNISTCGYYLRACYSGDNKLGWGVGNDGEIRPYDCDGPLNYYPPVAIRPAVWIKQVTK